MPGFLLHEGAVVLCAHAGQAEPMIPSVRVQVSGMPIVTQESPYTVAGCIFPPPPAANGPCITAEWVVAAVRVFSEGMPVLLSEGMAICAPTGTPLEVVFSQFRVQGT
ncbi:MAG: hypothetical protein ACYDER_02830 [Ktedonobacteraceae bacterium]